MAVTNKYQSTLQLVLDDGADVKTGETIYKTKSFRNVKTDASADALYSISNAFVSLQERDLFKVQRQDSSEIHAE